MERAKKYKISRRDTLKGLIGLPVLGYFANRFYVSQKKALSKPKLNWSEYGISEYDPDIIPATGYSTKGNRIRLGVVGNGGRGPAIYRALGYAQEKWAERFIVDGAPTSLLKNFLDQDDLNIEITGVCESYSERAEDAVKTVTSPFRSGGALKADTPKIYPTYMICCRMIILMPLSF